MALLPVAGARARILSGVAPLPAETVPLADAPGRTLAAPLLARRTQPPFDNSAMDGYAVRAAEAVPGARLRVIGQSQAGQRFSGVVASGEAVRIFTGAPMPDGADSVLIQENASRDGETLIVNEAARPGQHIRRAGIDFTRGDELLPAGHRLRPRDLGLAAGLGFGALPVRRRPRIALLATGDELVPPGTEPGPDQIVATSGAALAALIAAQGGEPVDLGIVRDDTAALAQALERARAAEPDALVTLGGASVGDHDLVHGALTAAGVALDFWKIAMRPGKPMMFGRGNGLTVFGLPGNPVSAHVCALLFVVPFLHALLGRADIGPELRPARLGAPLAANGPREHYIRAQVTWGEDGVPVALPAASQDSSLTRILAHADALIVQAPGEGASVAGAPCRVLMLGDDC